MTHRFPDRLLAELSTHVAAQLGLDFPCSKWPAMERAFNGAAKELGLADPEDCATRFMATPPNKELVETVAGFLTVGETYFMREESTFHALADQIIPAIVRQRRLGEKRLRIWSAGCASGEEPYTMAILLHRMGAALQGWTASILATDINIQALRKAAKGRYTTWSFRGTPQWFTENYFRKTRDDRLQLLPQIRGMVRFSCLNLVTDPYPSLLNDTNAMDIIFCRNVLMYFTPEQAQNVVERLHHCLVDGGWLVVSPCEASILPSSRFAVVSFPGGFLYRKVPSGTPAPSTRPLGIPPPAPLAGKAAPVAGKGTAKAPAPLPAEPLSPGPYEQALVLYEQGLYREADLRLSMGLSRNPTDGRALALLCRIRANEGKLAEALVLADQAIETDKFNAGLHYLRAVILQEQGALDEAVTALRRSLYLDQDLVLAHFTLGNLTMRQDKTKESRLHFAHALTILDHYQPDETLPGSDGLLAGRLREIIRSTNARP